MFSLLTPLNRKLLRDCLQLKTQILAITLVMAAGISVFIIMFSVLDSLSLTKRTYYDRYQFADVFASLTRAPETLKSRIQEIPGVSVVETRVVSGGILQMDHMIEPVSARLNSIPETSELLLNKLYLRSGRFPAPTEKDEVLVIESFYKAHNLQLGDQLSIVINGFQRQLQVVGVVLSPEYVYTIAPGALMPDDQHYGIFWMNRRSLESAVNMKGAFNNVSLTLSKDARSEDVKFALDKLLKQYGGLIAYDRKDQLSNFFVENELKQLRVLGMMAPVIFLSVAAFLVNVVMSRQVSTQRSQIGMLKAVGYTDLEISLLYLKMVLLISVLGAICGIVLGTWLGAGMIEMYATFFQFPILTYRFSYEVMLLALFICSAAAVLGTLRAVRNAASLPPAESMRPESPAVYRETCLSHSGIYSCLSFISRIIIRQLERRPVRALFSALGLSLSMAILIFSFFMQDAMDYMLDVQYDLNQREDLHLSFADAKPLRALEEIKLLPGVLKVEPIRQVPVILISGHLKKRTSITGLVQQPDLFRVIDEQLEPLRMPEQGIAINRRMAEKLGLSIGDTVAIDILEGKRQTIEVSITSLVEEFMGMGVYMDIHFLSRLLDESPRMNSAAVMMDHSQSGLLYKKLKEIPSVQALNIVPVLRKIFEDIMAENMLKMASINILFACFISFGVIYNTARIALSERGRELANLRVLGLTRREVAYLLFGELGLITLISLPLGMGLGYGLSLAMLVSMDTELYSMPVHIDKSTYGLSTLIVLVSAGLSFYLVWRKVDAIDLVAAQKGIE
jgi:putative ABC transport system permease protein